MSLDSVVESGQPVSWWVFRNAVSATQILVTVVAFVAVLIWALTDDNGQHVWEQYTLFSAAVAEWAQQLPLPWG